jgi:hypothetical protein
LADLTEDDLQQLQGKSEAWWIEYKESTTNPDLAKAVASFANYHGGWIVLGVEATEQNEPVLPAKGLDPAQWQVERVRQVVTSHLSPVPDVHVHSVPLANGRPVMLVRVEEGVEPPYIRVQDGRIYVRRGEVTEPIDYVRDRQELDRLYDRAERLASRWQRRLEQRGHSRVLREYHQAVVAREQGPSQNKAQVVMVLVPWSTHDEELGLVWVSNPRQGWGIFAGAASWHERGERCCWQHGELIAQRPATEEHSTVSVCVGRDGVLCLSILTPWPDLLAATRNLPHCLMGFLANALRAYTSRQYYGRLRALVEVWRGATLETVAEREWSVSSVPVATDESSAEAQQAMERWWWQSATDLLEELQHWAEERDRTVGS